ncbi:MAG: tRNA epoxyqueuosine(34) reductase QueG [Candidatus Latescibacterota bacterium]
MAAPGSRETLIKRTALAVGFSTVGIAPVSPCSTSHRIFEKWLQEGRHADMHFLSRWARRRDNNQLLLKGAKSAICVGLNYYSRRVEANESISGSEGTGVVSIYAHGRDYHAVMGDMLASLALRLRSIFPSFNTVSCVDTKPLSDRTMAILAGMAWPGKNTNVISPQFGSWIFLGSLLTNLTLEPDEPLQSECGDCTLCIDSCPTGAIEERSGVDARKCISYLTVEKRGAIAYKMQRPIGLNVFGCD